MATVVDVDALSGGESAVAATGEKPVELAIRDWVKTASGYSDERVFFADQKVERPASDPYITIRLDGPVVLGATDAIYSNYVEGRPAGAQVELVVTGERVVTARIQVYNCPTVGRLSAVQVMTRVQLGISLPSVREALDAVGVSPFDVGAVQNLGALLGTSFDGRASLDVRFYTRETMSEYTTWIERVQGSANDVPYEIEE